MPALAQLLNRWPITAKLNPFPVSEKLPYLLGAVIVARTAVGLTRIAADNPAWNPNPGTKQDKVSTLLERVFMEGLGTMGTFLVLHAGQDVFANGIELARPQLQPTALLNQLKAHHLSPQAIGQVTEALARTFKIDVKDLGTSPVLARVIYDKANLHSFKTHLNDGALWQAVKGPAEQHFATLNRHALPAMAGGLVLSTVFGGVCWQWLNDNVVRKSVVPRLSQWLVGEKDSESALPNTQPTYDRPLLLAASQPLISHPSTTALNGAPPLTLHVNHPTPLQYVNMTLPNPLPLGGR